MVTIALISALCSVCHFMSHSTVGPQSSLLGYDINHTSSYPFVTARTFLSSGHNSPGRPLYTAIGCSLRKLVQY
ncbi:hypothetical protein BKA63DRAFT_524178 [Paraphoma chrysanthemicola]|nr:hypothetical protein BKA63DRAFT_524178 [Paraphoma chrysanthemicola]